MFEGEAVEFDAAARSVGVQLKNGCLIEARSVILATAGHARDHSVDRPGDLIELGHLQPRRSRKISERGRADLEDSKDYLYARTTTAGRIIIGGEDSEEVIEPDALIA
jgi:glycine/D-amino acid oxidase-like deaminating enzyme